MSRDSDDFAAREREDAAVHAARRMRREDRRRAERRRAAFVALSLAVAGALLLAVGLSVAAATRDGRSSGSGSTSAQAPSRVATQTAEPETSSLASPSAQTSAARKVTKPARTSTKKATVSVPPQAGILARKCGSSGCHSAAELSEVRIDTASAVGAIEAMVEAGRVRLTSKERATVIAALTRAKPKPQPRPKPQRFRIAIGSQGYEPSIIRASASRPVILNVGQGEGCAAGFLIPKLRVERDNSVGPVAINLGRVRPGRYRFSCGMEMVTGTLIVE